MPPLKQIKVGKGDKKVPVELICPWCEHKDNYLIAKYDQPTCKRCGKHVPKRKYI